MNKPGYTLLSEDQFLFLFKENCKNFSFDNDILYRGNGNRKEPFYLFNKHDKKRGNIITYVDFFNKISTDMDNFPVVRNNSLIGMGGGNNEKMIKFCTTISDSTFVHIVIPYDNAELVFCPSPDIYILQRTKINIDKNNFVKTTYNKSFKIPDEIKNISMKLNTKHIEYGYEFFTTSSCLLLSINKLDWFKQNIKLNESKDNKLNLENFLEDCLLSLLDDYHIYHGENGNYDTDDNSYRLWYYSSGDREFIDEHVCIEIFWDDNSLSEFCNFLLSLESKQILFKKRGYNTAIEINDDKDLIFPSVRIYPSLNDIKIL